MWQFRVWKWCFGFGVDLSLDNLTRHRVTWVDKTRSGDVHKVHFELLIEYNNKYFLLDSMEFVTVTEKFDGKDWYEVLFEN